MKPTPTWIILGDSTLVSFSTAAIGRAPHDLGRVVGREAIPAARPRDRGRRHACDVANELDAMAFLNRDVIAR